MCGIFGFVAPHAQDCDLSGIIDLLHHRGPDDSGTFKGVGIALAATRLSIIDLNGGHQPLANEDETIWLVCNGEIVNAPELRSLLISSGHHFKTHSDIETIVHGYEEWGENIIDRLRGMFAFGLWDTKVRKLLLARDRFGIKPLSFLRNGDRFAFSSEVSPMLKAMPDFPRLTNLEAIWRLLETGFIPSPLTPFQGIYRLPAAHFMTVQGPTERTICYWKPEYPIKGEHDPISLDEAAEGFIEHTLEALKAWRLSDVPVGSLLSGGIDSSSICALMTEISPEPIHTFTLGFEARSLDESGLARSTAQHIGSQHHEMFFRLDALDALPAVIRSLEEPHHSTTISWFRIFEGCHLAGFKVIMSGEGSDELLGGYNWYQMDRQLQPFFRLSPLLRKIASQSPLVKGRDKKQVLRYADSTIPSRFLWFQRGLDVGAIAALMIGPSYPGYDTYLMETYADDLRGRHPFDQMLFIESRTRLVDYINHGLDRVSMAHSVEARPAFLDHRLWEYTAHLPPEYKLNDRGNKYLLRHGMRGRLPEEVLNRRKKGLTSPQSSWFRKPRLPEWAEECLTPGAINQASIFRYPEVSRLLAEHRAGKQNHGTTLIKILTTQIWHQLFISSE
jgi:asparagine synthase (glutamine-hydrolysing)